MLNFEINKLLKEKNYRKLYLFGYYKKEIIEEFIEELIKIYVDSRDKKSLLRIFEVIDNYIKYYPNPESYGKFLYFYNHIHNKEFVRYFNELCKRFFKISIKNLTGKTEIKTNKKILAYYTGHSPGFNGKNYGHRNVWGSEIAAIKLMEEAAKEKEYFPIVFCNCDKEITFNGVMYLHFNKINIIKNQIDKMIVSRFVDFFVNYDLSKINKIYYILHDFIPHGMLIDGKKLPSSGRNLFYTFLPKIKKIIYVSEYQKNKSFNYFKYNNIPENKISIIPNGINIEHKYINFNNKIKNSFMYFSDPTRGLEKTCEIIVKLNEIYPDKNIKLNIYFSYVPKDIKEKYVDRYKYIIFHGKKTNIEIKQLLLKNHFWLYPNVNNDETFCIAGLEAMYTGNTIITLKDSGVDKTVSEKCGILIDKKSNITEEIIKNIKKYIDKPKNKLSLNAFKRSKSFDWKNIYQKWKKIF